MQVSIKGLKMFANALVTAKNSTSILTDACSTSKDSLVHQSILTSIPKIPWGILG